jgi:NhaP-type Na+/H+ or K+/H+ antiporter
MVFLLGIVWVCILFTKILPSDKLLLAKKNFILPTLLFTGFCSILIASIFSHKPKISKLIIFGVIFLVAFDSLRFVQKWIPFDPKNLVFQNLPVISAIKNNIGY